MATLDRVRLAAEIIWRHSAGRSLTMDSARHPLSLAYPCRSPGVAGKRRAKPWGASGVAEASGTSGNSGAAGQSSEQLEKIGDAMVVWVLGRNTL